MNIAKLSKLEIEMRGDPELGKAPKTIHSCTSLAWLDWNSCGQYFYKKIFGPNNTFPKRLIWTKDQSLSIFLLQQFQYPPSLTGSSKFIEFVKNFKADIKVDLSTIQFNHYLNCKKRWRKNSCRREISSLRVY